MLRDRAKKALAKKTKKGFVGYPVATIGLYGPTDKQATKVVVAIIAHEGAEAEPMRTWFSDADLRKEHAWQEEALVFIRTHEAKSIVMTDRIIGCPHQEGIDYPEGQSCPQCTFWTNKDRWSGETIQ